MNIFRKMQIFNIRTKTEVTMFYPRSFKAHPLFKILKNTFDKKKSLNGSQKIMLNIQKVNDVKMGFDRTFPTVKELRIIED